MVEVATILYVVCGIMAASVTHGLMYGRNSGGLSDRTIYTLTYLLEFWVLILGPLGLVSQIVSVCILRYLEGKWTTPKIPFSNLEVMK